MLLPQKSHLLPILLLLTAPILALPSLEDARDLLFPNLQRKYDAVAHALAPRDTQDLSNPFNCTTVCEITNSSLRAGRNACINVSNGATGGGAILHMAGSTVTAGNNININLDDASADRLVVLWLENVTFEAGGTINVNFGENGCLLTDEDCEVVIYMSNVTWVAGNTTRTVDTFAYYSRLDKGK
ncbi:uncharacterized protein BO72DRAFT_495592 [Aspergillus fijiensis CBS 313.89]|uniref:Uncharacterized protein n=1 Tax=Aspergillus fijiensis CBS 313.89 TaxID=1448319 RepID=A0A8G1RSH2_9EURO|nr:uncharacterized protein BO72DRAFT_495592 [Aspergillus fijiensis CBS 313.89]RAK78059.1 hypothetical protein BO72DRAFT_495592 [Aspergillus fijiensis CBS 313.89]